MYIHHVSLSPSEIFWLHKPDDAPVAALVKSITPDGKGEEAAGRLTLLGIPPHRIKGPGPAVAGVCPDEECPCVVWLQTPTLSRVLLLYATTCRGLWHMPGTYRVQQLHLLVVLINLNN